MDRLFKALYKSPLGLIEITATEKQVVSVLFDAKDVHENKGSIKPEVLSNCLFQLDQYFKGERRSFNLELLLSGTQFQIMVWNSLLKIPYGQTCSYSEVAADICNSKAVRAAGSAIGRNKINIIIPCHRVISGNRSLTGYGGQLWRKQWLLDHERRIKNE